MVLQAIWDGERLHVCGMRFDDGGAWECAAAVDVRGTLGNLWDTLLASAAEDATLTLRLPKTSGDALATPSAPDPVQVSTLAFDAADAIDLLTTPSNPPREDGVARGDSFRYWAKVAELVRELLARQRFLPALQHVGGDEYRGYWRAVVDDEPSSARVKALIAAMPPVCRALGEDERGADATGLIESFLWRSVDALVRRCLDGDELAHALHERADAAQPASVRWLRSLVGADSRLGGTASERAVIYQTVREWLAPIGPPKPARTCRTCLRLDAPVEGRLAGESAMWRLSLHLQDLNDPRFVVAASQLTAASGTSPLLLRRPFDGGLEQLRSDVGRAARCFPPLAACAAPDGPLELSLNLSEAYSFLRDAAPLLESEDFVVWLPVWWAEERPRLRMRLDVRPRGVDPNEGFGVMRLDALVDYDWRVAVGGDDLSLDEITQLAAAKEPLVRLRGRWTEVQASEVQGALRFVQKKGRGEMTLMEALRQCYVADDLDTGLPVEGLRGQGWIDTLLSSQDHGERIARLKPPKDFHGELRPYQQRGLEWLSFLSRLGLGACLADDMGLGKTIQLIALLLHERESGAILGPTLLVVPMSLVGNWRRELERFAPKVRVMIHHGTDRRTGKEFVDEVAKNDVVISTYALTYRDFEHLSAVSWHRVALDEAQNIKNPAAKQSAAVRGLRAVHRLALTGTPVENRLSELWSIVEFLNPGYLGSAADFRRRFAVPIERHRDTDRAARLRNLIRPFVLRRLKSDPRVEVDLPEKMEMEVFCNLTKEQAALYEGVVHEMLGQIDRAGGIQRRGLILATLVKLKQVCNHPALFLGDGSELPTRSGKCERLTEMLEEVLAEGDRALVFTQYRGMGELLKKLVESAFGREVLFLHGGTPRVQRDGMVERFQKGDSEPPIFLLSLKAGGFGLNLTAANHVFHFDRWWNPAVEDQATDRAHRIGQSRRVQVHKFVCVGTLEERIHALLEHKRQLADHVIGAGEEWVTELSTEALRDLFALSREAVGED